MTLPVSGPISFNAINVELGQAGTTTASLGQTSYRTLAGVASGAISLSNFYGKSSVTYKGVAGQYGVGPNSWFTVSTGNRFSVVNGVTNSLAFFMCQSNGGTTSGTRRGGFAVVDKATSSFLSAYGFNPISIYTIGIVSRISQDNWGNFWMTVNGSNSSGSRMCVLRPSDNYTTIYKQWAWTIAPEANDYSTAVNSNYSFLGSPAYPMLKVDSSQNFTYYWNRPSGAGATTTSGARVFRGTTSSNEMLYYNEPSADWSQYMIMTRTTNDFTVISQFALTNFNDLSTTGRNPGYLQIGPVSNLMAINGNGRIASSTSSGARTYLTWFNAGDASTAPTFITGARNTNSGVVPENSTTTGYLLAVDGSYEYWGGYSYIYKVNSSGIIVDGWQVTGLSINKGMVALNTSGLVYVGMENAQTGPARFSGQTTITRLLSGQVDGWSFTSYTAKNGQYVYNLAFGGTAYSQSFASGTVSYPWTRAGYNTAPTLPTVTSDLSMYAVSASDMFGSVFSG